MTRFWIALGAALTVALPAAAQDRGRDGITLTSTAWSESPTRWTIRPDGSIDDARGVDHFAIGLPIAMVARHAPPARGRYEAILRLLAPARRLVGHRIDCTTQHSDDYYGRVIWPDGTRLDFGFGCDGPVNRPIVDGVRAATVQVSEWIKDAPVVRRYQITTSEEYNRP